MLSAPDVAELDEVIAATWPAPQVEELGGWLLRFGHGFTGRANSVWPRREDGSLPLAEKLERVEAWYRALGLTSKLQLSPASEPIGLDEVLATRGYERSTEVLVETCGSPAPRGAVRGVELASEPDERWLGVWLGGRGFPRDQAELVLPMLRGSGEGTVFARVGDVAVGRASAHRGWVAITSMTTLPEARRRGHARAILAALTGWARGRDVSLCLNVECSNLPARALYESAGFEPVSAYWYRTLAP